MALEPRWRATPSPITEVGPLLVSPCSRVGSIFVGLTRHGRAEMPGIALDFTRFMNKVLKVHVEDMDVVVQPGLRREELNELRIVIAIGAPC